MQPDPYKNCLNKEISTKDNKTKYKWSYVQNYNI